jgi:hypothetical protein
MNGLPPPLPGVPDSRIDVSICDLIERISQFSDDDFDAQWLHLCEEEIVDLAVLLIQQFTTQLDGKMLCGLLLEIRSEEEPEQPTPVDIHPGYEFDEVT